ncbi:MAG: aspartate/glutamate racemase family protein [Gammaproteobacteria bacterium]|nr:aspartate/glutamate racemase family protein [Gammaproteobacteria bacterium]
MENHIKGDLSTRPIFGILGGMGPLSSAQFLHTIHKACLNQFSAEQEFPRIVMISDPIIPDRAKAIKDNNEQLIVSVFEEKINALSQLGANEIILTCITAHLYLDKLKNSTRKKLINMMKLLYEVLDLQQTECLLLSSMAVFEHQMIKHHKVIYPVIRDVQLLQNYILKIKLNYNADIFNHIKNLIDNMVLKYHVNSVVFACTELHLLNDFLKNCSLVLPYKIIDPLDLVANYIIQKYIF